MPRFDGTGPRGEGMFTGRGEGYCALRLPEPGSGEPAVGYAGIQDRSARHASVGDLLRAPASGQAPVRWVYVPCEQGRRGRFGKRCRANGRCDA
jgi:hypothetical protein